MTICQETEMISIVYFNPPLPEAKPNRKRAIRRFAKALMESVRSAKNK